MEGILEEDKTGVESGESHERDLLNQLQTLRDKKTDLYSVNVLKQFAGKTSIGSIYRGAFVSSALRRDVSDETAKDGRPALRRVLKGHFGKVYSCAWDSDSRTLASVAQDGKLIIWNAFTTHKIHSVPLNQSLPTSCSFSKDSRSVLCSHIDGVIALYGIYKGEASPSAEFKSHSAYVSCCRFISSDTFVSSSGDCSLKSWSIETRQPISTFLGHEEDVLCVETPHDQKVFVSGSSDGTVKLWDIRKPKAAQTFSGHSADVNSVAWFPDYCAIGTASEDSTCLIIDIRSRTPLQVYHDSKVDCAATCVDFSHSGSVLLAGYEDHRCIMWDLLEGTKVPIDIEHDHRITCLKVAPDGFGFATGSWDSRLKVFSSISNLFLTSSSDMGLNPCIDEQAIAFGKVCQTSAQKAVKLVEDQPGPDRHVLKQEHANTRLWIHPLTQELIQMLLCNV
jgi:guanine nucleotide-binding protein G(I)/G(S)/G(T) subunit beta-1